VLEPIPVAAFSLIMDNAASRFTDRIAVAIEPMLELCFTAQYRATNRTLPDERYSNEAFVRLETSLIMSRDHRSATADF